MKLIKIVCLTTIVTGSTEAIQIENRSMDNAYINQITTLRNNGLDSIPYIQQTYIIVAPGQTIDTSTYGDRYQKVNALSFNLGSSKFDISVPPENSSARVTINNDGSVVTSEGVGMSRHGQSLSKQIGIQRPHIL